MASRDYWDFIHETQDVFGFDLAQARDYYAEFKAVFTDGHPATVDDLREWGDVALDLAEDYLLADTEEEDYGRTYDRVARERYDDEQFYDDDAVDDDPWIDEGDELEVTVELTYQGE